MNEIPTFNSVKEEFNKIKRELVNDLKIIQRDYANSQKKLKIAEEILQKTKIEYKKLNEEYVKLVEYKNKCEKFIQYLQDENNKTLQKLNGLYEQNHNKYRNNRNNLNRYYQLQEKNTEKIKEEEEQEEEQEKQEEEEEQEEDITDDIEPLIIKKANKPPPNKIRKIKKGISNFI